MEKNTITIEIKQEVSITLVWIVAGVIVVSLAFLLTPRSTEVWPALNTAGIFAGAYLIALLIYALWKPISRRLRVAGGIVAIVVLACSAFTWVRMEDQTRWQVDQVMRVRTLIGRGVMCYEMPIPLLKTLEAYHQQGVEKKETLADVFRRLQNGATVGSNIHKPSWEGDPMTVTVEALDLNRIVLISQETYVKGREPNFKNYDGKAGMVQEKFILTKKGISHVSEN
ncbi:MAG: hypothetical protein AABZ02_11880 [Bacteroidota bacterium]